MARILPDVADTSFLRECAEPYPRADARSHDARSHVAADRWLFRGYQALLITLPLPLGANHLWAWALFGVWSVVLATGWLVLWLRGRVQVPAGLSSARSTALPLLLFALWAGIQIVPLPVAWVGASGLVGGAGSWSTLSLDPAHGEARLLQTLGYLLLFSLTLALVHDRDRVRRVLMVLVVAGTLQASYGALMTLSGLEYGFFTHKDAYLGLATGTFVNRNHLAGYLEMTLACGLGLMLGAMRGDGSRGLRPTVAGLARATLSGKGVLRIGLIVMVIGLILTHSRMGNTAFMVGLGAGGLAWVAAVKGADRRLALWFLGSVLVIDVVLVGQLFGFEEVVARIEHTSLATEGRASALAYARDYLRDYWLAGSGGGSFYAVFPAYVGSFIGYYDHAHNDYVELWVEYGIIGLALLAGAVLASLVDALRGLYRGSDRLLQGAALAVLVGIFSLLVHSWADFNLQIPANAATFVVLMALGQVVGRLQRTCVGQVGIR